VSTAIRPTSLDHIALWVADRGELAALLCEHFGMHEVSRGEDFTLVGVDAKLGKVTLFDADGPREPGLLHGIALRVGDLDAAVAALPAGLGVTRADGAASIEAPQGVRLVLVEAAGRDYDLDHVALRVPDPERTAAGLTELGFERADGSLAVGERSLRLEAGDVSDGGRPLLNHLALLVDSAAAVQAEAGRLGIEVLEVKDAENTLAVFVCGPDELVVEYVEHKPGFALV
jgi:catechol 2,3-dioxygenase-like lactoylglutathione lyase family enzyme